MQNVRPRARPPPPPAPSLQLFCLPSGWLPPFLSLATTSVFFAIATTTITSSRRRRRRGTRATLPSTLDGIRCTNREPRADQWRLAAGWSSREQPPRSLLLLALPRITLPSPVSSYLPLRVLFLSFLFTPRRRLAAYPRGGLIP